MKRGIAVLCIVLALAVPRRPGATEPAPSCQPTTPAQCAWVASYEVRDAERRYSLTLVRNEERVELRDADRAVQVWQRDAEGLRHYDIPAGSLRGVAYYPGDLRALGRASDWTPSLPLVPEAAYGRLVPTAVSRRPAEPHRATHHFRGEIGDSPVALQWSATSGLPLEYTQGRSRSRVVLKLKSLRRVPAASAFTDLAALSLIDYADLGDMTQDPFVRGYLSRTVASGHGHAH